MGETIHMSNRRTVFLILAVVPLIAAASIAGYVWIGGFIHQPPARNPAASQLDAGVTPALVDGLTAEQVAIIHAADPALRVIGVDPGLARGIGPVYFIPRCSTGQASRLNTLPSDGQWRAMNGVKTLDDALAILGRPSFAAVDPVQMLGLIPYRNGSLTIRGAGDRWIIVTAYHGTGAETADDYAYKGQSSRGVMDFDQWYAVHQHGPRGLEWNQLRPGFVRQSVKDAIGAPESPGVIVPGQPDVTCDLFTDGIVVYRKSDGVSRLWFAFVYPPA